MNKPGIIVPYTALAQQTREIKKELMVAVETVLDSGQYILGPEVAAFENEFARYCGVSFAAGVSDGTSAISMAMRAFGVGPGDEVITAPNSFIASASSIALIGATPVFADIGADMNIDPAQIACKITPRTKAILPVHLTGRPAKMHDILQIARDHKLKVVEDAAQAVGAKLGGKRVGSLGDAACFSMHPLKNLHAFGDGGMVTAPETAFIEKIKQSRNHGLKSRDECEYWSFNTRLDEIQAAMLRVELKSLDAWTDQRRVLALRYHKALKGIVAIPEEGKDEYHVYHTYMIRTGHRDELQHFLANKGVQTAIHYPVPIPAHPAARYLGCSAKDFPETFKAASEILSLPLYPSLTLPLQDHVIQCVLEFFKR